jgi:hypothetical protein
VTEITEKEIKEYTTESDSECRLLVNRSATEEFKKGVKR